MKVRWQVGITRGVSTRLIHHRSGRGSEFVKKYGVHRLVDVEEFASRRKPLRAKSN
jgi:putative endonuclease